MPEIELESDELFNSKKVAVVAAKWNSFVTDEMLEGAVAALKAKGVKTENLYIMRCPGSFELPLSCKYCIDNLQVDAVVAIGAVIRGGTPHFDFVCDAVTRGITDLNMETGIPVAFGVLTTDTVEQATERAGMDKGNKGAEAALSALEMIRLKDSIK
ncbi:6,7-dimethyl-8-ribityllumazine synthase [Rhodohalobacter halophilus]|uniref:6,7-dimethyl-8-ribityllumazine synthase n=1 Tax=Rhodohalobacter halophilus TaxID=1812810 RepID=UPI00083F9939|nr:6,7-dimethyl-8-ribityllumazine synthase [Rhodohalobacter halophilus]